MRAFSSDRIYLSLNMVMAGVVGNKKSYKHVSIFDHVMIVGQSFALQL